MLSDVLERTHRGGRMLLVGSATGRLLDLASTVLLTHALGLAHYGVLIAARALSGVVNALLTARSFELLLVYLPRFERNGEKRQARDLFALTLCIELVLGLAGLVLSLVLATLLPSLLPDASDSAWLLLPFGFCRHWGNNLVDNNQALFRLRERYVTSAGQVLLAPLYRLLGLAVALALGHGLLVMAFVDGAASLLAWLSGALVLRAKERCPLGLRSFRPYRDHAAEFWRFSRANWAAASVRSVSGHGAEVALSVLASAEAVGAFGLARRLASTVAVLVDPLLQAITPEIFRLAAEGEVRTLRRYLLRVTGYALLIVPPLAAALIVFSEPITALAGGGEFAAASAPLVWLVLGFSAHHALGWLRPLLLAFRRARAVLVAQLAMGLALAITCLLAVPSHQASGAGVAVLLGQLAQVAVMGLVAWRLLDERRASSP